MLVNLFSDRQPPVPMLWCVLYVQDLNVLHLPWYVRLIYASSRAFCQCKENSAGGCSGWSADMPHR